MKYCEEYEALLSAFADDACTPEEAEQVREHLAVCPGCRAYWNEILQIKSAFPDVESVEVPEGLADGICAAVRAQPAVRRRRSASAWAKILAPMAACLLIAVVLGFPSADRNVVPQRADTEQQEPVDADGADSTAPDASDSSAAQYQSEARADADTETSAPVSGKDKDLSSTGDNSTEGEVSGKSVSPANEVGVAPAIMNAEDSYARSLTLTQAQADSLPAELSALLSEDTLVSDDGTVRVYTISASEFDAISARFPQAEATSDPAAADADSCCIRVTAEEVSK